MNLQDTARKVLELSKHATEAPWAWEYISDQGNGYILGTAANEAGELHDGFIDRDCNEDFEFDESLVEYSEVGSHEASTCNYTDPELITFYRTAAPILAAAILKGDY